MFEKEAEEIANKKLCEDMMCFNRCNFSNPKHHRCGDWHKYYETAKECAEFGYNKANEWHYVKDGLPKELHDVSCFVIHNEHRYVLQGYIRDGRWVLSPLGTYLNNDDVIAWKEIVLPELPKESV